MPGLEDLYREIILDHHRTPRNRGELPPPAAHAVGHNPLCGDEIDVAGYALRTLRERFGDEITLHGPTNVEVRGATFSFEFRGIHPHDLSQVLDQRNVCVRAGHHCAKPLMRELGVNATARASFYLYNDTADVDSLADALDSASDIFGS